MKRILFLFLGLMAWEGAWGQQEVFSKSEVVTGNWGDGSLPWFYATSNFSQGDPDNGNTTANLVRIGHNNNTTMTLNGRAYRVKELVFQVAATAERTFTGNILDLRYQSGGPTKIENLSTANHTFNNSIALHDGTCELNPINGNITFTANIFNNGNFIDVFGNNGDSLIISGVLQGTGGITLKQNSILYLTGQNTYTGGTFVEGGTLRLNRTGGGTLPSSNDITVSNGATLRISTNQELNNLTVNAGGSVVVDAGVALTISGTLTNNGTLTLEATDESTYAQLITSGTVSGNVTAKRAITGSTQGWRFISPPASGTLANLGTVQLTGAANVISMNTSNPNAWVVQGGAGTDALVAGRGYALYFGNTGVNNNDVSTTLSLTGAIQNADVTVAGLSDGNGSNDFGWTLVGNPFPSGLDWSNVNHTKTNIADAYYIWNPTLGGSGQYASFVGGVSNPLGALDANIPPMQGFFVKATAATPVLTFSAQSRTSSATKAQLRTSNYANLLQVRVTNEVNGLWDETAIVSRSNATAAYEDSYDAFKLNSFNADAVNLSSLSSDQRKLSINSTSLWDQQTTIPLYLTSSQAVAMRMTVDLDEVDPATPVFLEDLLLNQFHDLRTGDYHFVHQIGQHNRFIIHFNNLAAASISQNTMERALVYAFEGALYVKGLQGAAAVRMMDMQGRVVFEAQNASVDAAMLLPQLAKGTYLVQVQQGQGSKTVKLIF